MILDNKSNPLKPVTVYLEFDSKLQLITGTAREEIELTEGTPFIMFLQAILETYPRIIENFAMSSLAFSVNGIAPTIRATLSKNDVISLLVANNRDEDDSNLSYYQYRQ
jgi:hypothetical protein